MSAFDLADDGLMAGKHQGTGEQLVAPKFGGAGRREGAARAAGGRRDGCGRRARPWADPVDVFGPPKQRSAWNTAARAVAPRGDAALLRIDEALAVGVVAGLEAEQVWPTVDLVATYSNFVRAEAGAR